MNQNLNRRNFLKIGTITSTGLFLNASTANAESEKKKRKVINRKLGKTDIKLPVVSMGVMRADNPNLVRAALNSGVVHFDTAHGYQNGRNEEMLGKVFKNYSRDKFVLATKINMPKENGEFNGQSTPGDFMEKFETSLKRLQMDYVDILYLHSIKTRQAALYEPFMEVMQKLKDEGRVRHVGLSTHSNEPEVIQAAIDSNFYEVVLTAYNFKQDHRDEMEKLIAKADEAGLGIVAMKTMAGGYYDREKTKPINTKAALKWALKNPHVHTAIPGFTSFDQLEESLSVMEDLKLSSEERNDLKLGFNEQGLYCQGCEKCVPQCRGMLPVPDIMRSYMYTYGYRDLAKAKDVLVYLNIPDDPCSSCNECLVRCAKGFDIAGKINDVIRVRNIPNEFLV